MRFKYSTTDPSQDEFDALPRLPLVLRLNSQSVEVVGLVDSAAAFGQVLLVKHFDAPEVLLKGLDETVGQDCDAVFSPLAVAYEDLAPVEVNILDPQPQALDQPKAGAVEQLGDQLIVAGHGSEHSLNLLLCQDSR